MLSKAKERSVMSHNVSSDNEAQHKNIHAAWQPLDRLPKAARKGEPRGSELQQVIPFPLINETIGRRSFGF